MRNKAYTILLVALFVAVTLQAISVFDKQRTAMKRLDAVAAMGQRENAEYKRLEKAYSPVLDKAYFAGPDYTEFARGAVAEQKAAYFAPGRDAEEKLAVDGFWWPYQGQAKDDIEKSRSADEAYTENFPTLVSMSTIRQACLGQRLTADQWIDEYEVESPDALDQLRAKVQAAIQQQTTTKDCAAIEAAGGFRTGTQ